MKTNTIKEIEILEPVFKENYTAIAMSSSDEYIPYLSVCLQSLVEHASDNHNYDVIVLERNIDKFSKKRLLKQFENNSNISLRFLNPMPIISQYNLSFPVSYNLECFFRLSIPLLVKNYDKIIFTDIDLIFNEDIKNLYSIDICGYPLAACQDLMFQAFLKTPNTSWHEYAIKTLKLQHPEKYFNTGVLLINIKEFINNNYPTKLLDLVSKNNYKILEQDGLNAFFKDEIKYIDTAWNYPIANKKYNKIMKYMPSNYYEQYINDENHPKIIHWAGKSKPWNDLNEDKAEIWWMHARKTPYYEILLKRMLQDNKPNLIEAFQYRKNILIYWKYKILSAITFGKKKEYYKNKRTIWKHKIWQGKTLRGIN